jgi:hypothetical protein
MEYIYLIIYLIIGPLLMGYSFVVFLEMAYIYANGKNTTFSQMKTVKPVKYLLKCIVGFVFRTIIRHPRKGENKINNIENSVSGMADNRQIYDYACKLISEEHKSKEDAVNMLTGMGVDENKASNICAEIFYYLQDAEVRSYTSCALTKSINLFTINGMGVKFLGQSNYWSDGSYITIRWLVCLWVIPVFPLDAYRVRNVLVRDNGGLLEADNGRYVIYYKEKLTWKLIVSCV